MANGTTANQNNGMVKHVIGQISGVPGLGPQTLKVTKRSSTRPGRSTKVVKAK